MNRKGVFGWFIRWYRPLLTIALIFSVCFLLYGWRLGSLNVGFSPEEKVAVTASSTIRLIVIDPINAPHKVPQYIIQKSISKEPRAMKAVSVFYAILAVFCFYLVLRWWFKYQVAVLGAVLFATSPWLIINARSATPDIMLLASLGVITAYLWMQSTNKHHNSALICVALAGALSLYIPGVFWLSVLGVIAVRRPLMNAYKSSARLVRFTLPVITALILTPLVYASAMDFKVVQKLLLIPNSLQGPLQSAESVIWTGLSVVWRTRDNLPTTVGTLPVLDAFCVVLFIIGSFWMLTQVKRRRTYWLFGSMLVALVVIGLNRQTLELLLILPAIYIVVAGGLNFLYTEWFRVFPRNPLAKWVGLGVIILVVAISAVYSVRYSLIAWPNSPETSEHYMLQ